jgi:hypothetical protein
MWVGMLNAIEAMQVERDSPAFWWLLASAVLFLFEGSLMEQQPRVDTRVFWWGAILGRLWLAGMGVYVPAQYHALVLSNNLLGVIYALCHL